MGKSYKNSGVDIQAGEETVDRIKKLVKSTFSKNVLTGIGHFGAFYELDLTNYKNPVMVSSVDGVGTKLKVAFMMDKHDTVGQDLVNHCVNDIAVCGADPLYFMDYLAFGKLFPDKAEKIIEGFSIACGENGVSLIGGETAEMPGLYDENEYDMSGTIVGIVDKENIIDGTNVKKGNLLFGFESTGLHTNGYSLARNVLFEKYNVNDVPEGFDKSIGQELLSVHKSYLKLIRVIKNNLKVNAFSHITGGGILGNTKRVVPEGLSMNIDWSAWQLPPIFELIKNVGEIADEEMRSAFNLGIGLIAIVDEKDADKLISASSSINEKAILMGRII
ncbi:MAG: phosphoribosylformylglycinamidine cyclo-ligase [Ignavibacteria bacterium GWB2_35_6b]|nr:MAG: phosphoribosylformylglycinamidine cyclo-ligase [Ignavibacteria bacterium GWB2_35_6b]